MPIWLLWLLPAYEAGFWSALIAGKLRNRGKVRELLVHGKRARTTLPFIDERLRKAAGPSTATQAFAVKHLAAGIRWLANTRALEHALLLGIKKLGPKGNSISSEVRLSL